MKCPFRALTRAYCSKFAALYSICDALDAIYKESLMIIALCEYDRYLSPPVLCHVRPGAAQDEAVCITQC